MIEINLIPDDIDERLEAARKRRNSECSLANYHRKRKAGVPRAKAAPLTEAQKQRRRELNRDPERAEKRRTNSRASRAKYFEKYNAQRRERAKRDPWINRSGNLKWKYGMTKGQVEQMFADQGGRCATCSKELQLWTKRCHVDHCHKTGKVRGILCWRCNLALGRYELTILPNLQRFNAYLGI